MLGLVLMLMHVRCGMSGLRRSSVWGVVHRLIGGGVLRASKISPRAETLDLTPVKSEERPGLKVILSADYRPFVPCRAA